MKDVVAHRRDSTNNCMGLGNNESSCLPEGVSLGFFNAYLHVLWRGDVRNKGYIRASEVYVVLDPPTETKTAFYTPKGA